MSKKLTVGSLIESKRGPESRPVAQRLASHGLAPRTSSVPPVATPPRPIKLRQSGRSLVVSALSGATLLQAGLRQAQPIAYKCQKGTCGQCAVQVIAGAEQLSPPTPLEQQTLSASRTSGLRLSCQARFCC
ncbi:hypothetical protein CIG75_02890 [Tumebacillus algifaecis]|uniref:2Fe-2S ferredoxin-type domain-containing protein n=1 Tax=Tumebacillus algifaecis TaxID=1214604 RepID=A0A223CXF4_9BACL|nr:2Fe-2S iron-sulfur cluster-binding protein [Tumebacillus algifaecis]ASS74030.1 hypothetical protein CIG75_02890 [Tumebacillus algifaecis]